MELLKLLEEEKMNKQEAIETLQDVAQGVFYRRGGRSVYIDKIVEVVNQIDETQKVIIPKFVAEWIEKEKKKKRRLSHALRHVFEDLEVGLYIKQQEGDYTETIAKAWLYGYKVELYTVEIPNPKGDSLTVLEKFDDDTVVISQMDVFPVDWRNLAEYHLTEREIRKDFEWAWQWAKEVE